MLKALTLLVLCSAAIGLSSSPGCQAQNNRNGKTAVENQKKDPDELRPLAEGSNSAIEDPFIAVIRDGETYDQLRQLEPNLPHLGADFFNENTVIAAFLGTRNTAGYSVAISRGPRGDLRVAEKSPPKGAMTAQVITSPYKLVSFASNGLISVELSADEIFRSNAQLYRINSGSFDVSGGLSGQGESMKLNGKLQLTRLGGLVTIGFAIVTSGSARERSLRDAATGVIKDGKIVISRLSHGSLLDPPSGELQINGTFLEHDKLSLEVTSKPLNVPENYSGRGLIAAGLVSAK